MPNKLSQSDYLQNQRAKSAARVWLWVGVLSFTAVIGAIWIWSVKLRFAFFDWNDTPEHSLTAATQKSWDEIFNNKQTTTTTSVLENIKLREAMSKIFNTNSSTVTTGTTNTNIENSKP